MTMVRYDLDNLPEVTQEERTKVAAMSDEDIDYSDIPEVNDFSGFILAEKLASGKKRNRMEIDLDSDVAAWVGKDYQSRINTILREVMNLSRIASAR